MRPILFPHEIEVLETALSLTFTAHSGAPSPSSTESKFISHFSFHFLLAQYRPYVFLPPKNCSSTRPPRKTLSSSRLMAPKDLISIGTSEKRVAPHQNDTFHFRPSSTRKNGDHRLGPSNPSRSPSYAWDIPFEVPFQVGDGVQEGFQPSPAKKLDPTPTAAIVIPLPPVPSPNDDPFTIETVLDDSLSPLPPFPTRPPGLMRGLQIPSRISLISWGFSFPKILLEHGVSKPHWRQFKHELKKFAHMSFGQWAQVLVTSHAVAAVFGQPAGQSLDRVIRSIMLRMNQVLSAIIKCRNVESMRTSFKHIEVGSRKCLRIGGMMTTFIH